MAYTDLEDKAINWWMKKEDVKLNGLALMGQISFIDSKGVVTERNVRNLLTEFLAARKEEAKETARARKAQKAKGARK